jgi:putative tryptophan/tyrosine transport system substrate-binding protein
MDRRRFIANLTGSVVALPAALAQSTAKLHRIGYLAPGSRSSAPASVMVDVFRQRLSELGWVEGRTIVIDYRFANGQFDRLPRLAAELVEAKCDVIVAAPTPAAVAASKATQTIPVVMINVGDPVGLGLVTSLARPGRNITGLAYSIGVESLVKSVGLLKEAVPKLRRVAILANPANPSHAVVIGSVEAAAQSLGVQLQVVQARGHEDLDAAFAAMASERAQGLLVIADVIFVRERARLADLASRHRLPTVHGLRENVEAGGLIHYGPNSADQWRRAATFVDRILKGAKPANLPVEQPTRFELIINLRTAKALGLDMPSALLLRADELIQ